MSLRICYMINAQVAASEAQGMDCTRSWKHAQQMVYKHVLFVLQHCVAMGTHGLHVG